MKISSIIIASTLFAGPLALANPVDEELVESLPRTAAEHFWDKGVLSSGQPVQRPPDLDPDTPIIPPADSQRVVEAAFRVGAAMWCDVEWRPYYVRFMQAERKRNWNEVQVAYIGFLFGMAQQTFYAALTRGSDVACSPERRSEVETALGAKAP